MVLGLEEFKDVMKRYAEIESELERGGKTLSGLRKTRNELATYLLEYMQHHDLQVVNIGSEHQIRRVKTKSVEGLKRDAILEEFNKIIGDGERAERAVEKLMGNRHVIEKEVLKKSKKKDI
jgi:hypothetical protein